MANATTLTLVAQAEQHVSSTTYYSVIVVDNSESTDEVYVCTDGGTASVEGAHCLQVPPGHTKVLGNLLPLPNPNVVAPNPATFVSVISAGTPDVTVTLQ